MNHFFIEDADIRVYEAASADGAGGASRARTIDATVADSVPGQGKHGQLGQWRVVVKAWSEEEGWFKTTKAMPIPGIGVVMQTTTREQGVGLCDALLEIRGACLTENEDLTVNIHSAMDCGVSPGVVVAFREPKS